MASQSHALSLASRKGTLATLGKPNQVNAAPAGVIGAPPQGADLPVVPHRAREVVVQPASLATLAAIGSTPSTARRNLHAAKVLTRLVRSVVMTDPATASRPESQAARLAELFQSAQALAEQILTTLAPRQEDSGWLYASALESAVHMVAAHHESQRLREHSSLDEQAQVLAAVFARLQPGDGHDGALGAIVDVLGQAQYQPAQSREVALSRLRLSTALATWDLRGSVTHESLGSGSFRFTYGHKPEEVVARLLPAALELAREFGMAGPDLETNTSHQQACIRRAAEVLGAQYVARTRSLMDWIAAEGISDAEYRRRYQQGCGWLDPKIVPEVVQCARQIIQEIQSIVEQAHHDPQEHAHATSPSGPDLRRSAARGG